MHTINVSLKTNSLHSMNHKILEIINRWDPVCVCVCMRMCVVLIHQQSVSGECVKASSVYYNIPRLGGFAVVVVFVFKKKKTHQRVWLYCQILNIQLLTAALHRKQVCESLHESQAADSKCIAEVVKWNSSLKVCFENCHLTSWF